jgi:hypothetical protein
MLLMFPMLMQSWSDNWHDRWGSVGCFRLLLLLLFGFRNDPCHSEVGLLLFRVDM